MSFRDVLRAVSLSDLSDKQKRDLKKVFENRRKELRAALAAVETCLTDLAKPAAKKIARRRR
jgi:hypothetical protein